MKKPKVHTIILLPGGVTVEVPGCGYIEKKSLYSKRLNGRLLAIAPENSVIVTNWDKPNHV